MSKVITITLKSPDEVMEEMGERLPSVKATPDRNWVWVHGPSKDSPEAETLKDIGFKWSQKRSAWYHTCESDPTKKSYRRSWKNKPRSYQPKPRQTTSHPPASGITTTRPKEKYQPTTNVADEFARRFG